MQEKHDAGRVCMSVQSVCATSLLARPGDMDLQQPWFY